MSKRWTGLSCARGFYATLKPDTERVVRSEVFPGLWLAPPAIFSGDLAAILVILQQGLASPEHSGFVARLQGD